MAKAPQHWRLERDAGGVAWLYLDQANSATNVLSSEVLEQLASMLDRLLAEPPAGLVIASGKEHGFIAGADVHEIATVTEFDAALRMVKRAQALFDRIEQLPFPTVAAINGFCLGGGLELALACRYRVADDAPATRLGLPEVMLGFHPGWGGTVRLTRLIGAPAALDLMLSGRTVDARRARKLGMIDYAVPRRHLQRAALGLLQELPAHRLPWWLKALELRPGRELLAYWVKRQVAKRAREEHYPAPYAIIELWRGHGGDWSRMMEHEAESAARLAMGETARNLIRVFMLRERLRELGKASPLQVRHVHVVGAGTMGGDIAAWCALRGLSVTLQDRGPAQIAPAIGRAAALFRKRLKQPHRVQAALDRLVPDPNGHGVARADLVIEAIVEDLQAKQDLFRALEARAPSTALLATNTSSIPLQEIAQALENPQRLIGLHFFNPVARMQLVEVVSTAETPPELIAQAAAFVRAIDRLALPVRSAPGFLVNRLLMPYLMEAVELVEQGVAPEVVDEAARRFGMPIGPVELADTVGLDVCLSVARVLTQHYGGEVPQPLEAMVSQGRLGRKTGQGFYTYAKNQRRERKHEKQQESELLTMADRMVLRIVNEAHACIAERVVTDGDLLDAGMVFGAGFAPFRGGVMHYAKRRGRADIIKTMEQLAGRIGKRFSPQPSLVAAVSAEE